MSTDLIINKNESLKMVSIKKLFSLTMILYTACLISSDDGKTLSACKERRTERRLATRAEQAREFAGRQALAAEDFDCPQTAPAGAGAGAGAGAFAGGGTGAASEAVSDSTTRPTPFTIHLFATSMDMNRYKYRKKIELGCAESIIDPLTGKTPLTGETTLDDLPAFIDKIQKQAIEAAHQAITCVDPEITNLRKDAKVKSPNLFIPYFSFNIDREFVSISGTANGSRTQTSGVRPEGFLGTNTNGKIVGVLYVKEILG